MSKYKVLVKSESIEYWTVIVDAKSKKEAERLASDPDVFQNGDMEIYSSDDEVEEVTLIPKKKNTMSDWIPAILNGCGRNNTKKSIIRFDVCFDGVGLIEGYQELELLERFFPKESFEQRKTYDEYRFNPKSYTASLSMPEVMEVSEFFEVRIGHGVVRVVRR